MALKSTAVAFLMTLAFASGVQGAAANVGAGSNPKASDLDTVLKAFDIPAQAANTALTEFAKQADISLVFSSDLVSGIQTRRLKGSYSIPQALAQLLQGTKLSYEQLSDKIVAISDRGTGRVTENGVGLGAVRLARSGASEPQIPDTGTGGEVRDAANDDSATPVMEEEEDVEREGIPEILVRGSKILNMDIKRSEDDPRPYVVFDRVAIERSGAVNLEDFFKSRLPMSTNSVSHSQGNSIVGNASTVNLRGLGADETLILIDGRRVAGFRFQDQQQQPDLNGVALTAIERIEILPATASGIYGGSATGGVINIVTRRDYEGIEGKLTYGNTFDTDAATRRVDLAGGFAPGSGKTSILWSASWSQANDLAVQDRDFARRAREHIARHDPDAFFLPLGSTTNIRSVSGAPLTLRGSQISLGSDVAFIPVGYAGVDTDDGAQLLASAGRFNLALADTAQSDGGLQSLINAPTIKSARGSLRHDFTPQVHGFLELDASENSGSFVRNQATDFHVVSSIAATNPFNETVMIAAPIHGYDRTVRSLLENRRVATGLTVELPRRWALGFDYVWNESKLTSNSPGGIDRAALAVAVDDGTLNFFRDTREFSLNLAPYALDDLETPPAATILRNTALRLSGPLDWTLLGGDLALSLLFEHRTEQSDDQYLFAPITVGLTARTLYPAQSQETNSVYAEALLPLVAPDNGIRGLHSLELQLALRYDDYQTVGARGVSVDESLQPTQDIARVADNLSSVDPSVAFRYQPVQFLTLRGSYGTGFLPPTPRQFIPASATTVYPGAQLSYLTDPRRGDEPFGALGTEFTERWDGAGTLQPEQSRSFSLGVIVAPAVIPALRIAVDWTTIRKTDNITALAVGSVSDFQYEDLVPDLIVRAPPPPGDPFDVGPVIGVNYGLFNIARLEVETYDIAFNYQFATERHGTFDIALDATKLESLRTQVVQSAPIVENAGVGSAARVLGGDRGGGLRWKAASTATWQRGALRLGWNARYFDDYYLDITHGFVPSQGSATVPSQMYHDVFGQYDFGAAKGILSDLIEHTELQIGINNIFNTKPPIDVVGQGFNAPGYSYFGDPRLANYYVSIRRSFGAD